MRGEDAAAESRSLRRFEPPEPSTVPKGARPSAIALAGTHLTLDDIERGAPGIGLGE